VEQFLSYDNEFNDLNESKDFFAREFGCEFR